MPLFTACAAGVMGLFCLGETNVVNSIRVLRDGELSGKLEIDVNITAIARRKIVVDVKDIHSVVALANDNLGREDEDENLLEIKGYIDTTTG